MHRLVDIDEPCKIDRRGDDNRLAIGRLHGGLEVPYLSVAVAHRGQQRTRVRVLHKSLSDAADRVGPRIDNLGRAVFARPVKMLSSS